MMKKLLSVWCLACCLFGGALSFAQEIVFGQNLTTSKGGQMIFRGQSSFGDPYWISDRPVLTGNAQAQWEACKSLETRERAALNHPEGYAYFPSVNNPGHVVLVPDKVPYRDGQTGDSVYAVSSTPPPAPPQAAPQGTPPPPPVVNGGNVSAQIAAKEAQIAQLQEEIAMLRAQAQQGNGRQAVTTTGRPPVRELAKVNVIVKQGESFHNGEGVWMEARAKSSQGNSFWRSGTNPLRGLGQEQMTAACNLLTEQEHQKGRIPRGYGYFPIMDNDGRYVLIPNSEVGFDYLSLPVAQPVSGVRGSVESPFVKGLRLDVTGILRGLPVSCPRTGKQFRLP